MFPPTVPPPGPCEIVVLVKPSRGMPDLIEIRANDAALAALIDTLTSARANAVIDPTTQTMREVGAYRVLVRVE